MSQNTVRVVAIVAVAAMLLSAAIVAGLSLVG